MNKILSYFHTPISFIQEAYKQPSTYIGIGAFVFYAFCHHGINQVIVNVVVQIGKDLPVLTSNIMRSPELVATIIQGLSGIGWGGFIVWRGKKKNVE